MHAIILAGGFAKRLWPLTKDTPKPLLPVGGKPIIEYILEKLVDIDEIKKIHLSVNKKFEPHFEKWAKESHLGDMVDVITEPAMTEKQKFGAIGALGFLLKEKDISDDLLVIAGDNLFDFDVKKFITSQSGECPIIALYDMYEKDKVKKKYGVVVMDENNVIKHFHEKPEQPLSTMVSTGCYLFPKTSVEKIHDYLSDGHNPDAPGFFISWLAKQMSVHGFVFDGECKWFDIGSFESYEEAKRTYGKKSKTGQDDG
jgi:glucose-1-phosphate thymidylyltransferase